MRSRLAGLVAVAALIGGCSLPTGDGSVVVGPVEPPPARDFGRSPPVEPADEIAGRGTDVVVLVGPDGELVVENRPVRLDRRADVVRALDTLLAPLSRSEAERGRSTEIPSATRLVDVHEHDRGRVEVELSADFDRPGTDTEMDRRLTQVVCTVAFSTPVELVEIAIDGRTLTSIQVGVCPAA